jgi:hypothetical protein
MSIPAEQEMQVSVHAGVVTVQVGKLQLSVPTQTVGDVAKAFSAALILVGTPTPPAARVAANAAAGRPAAPAPAPDPLPEPKRRGRPPATNGDATPSKGRRRSRKRVGDALAAWLKGHPGWYTEAELLDLVIREKMSDAEPNRALKIALGKQRDTFEQDEAGRWRLRHAAVAEVVAPKRGRGRPKGSGLKKSIAAESAPPVPAKGMGRPGPQKSAAAVAPEDGEAPVRRKPGRPKGSGLKRASREALVVEAPVAAAQKPVRIKRGQTREEVLPRGRNAKSAAELDVDRIRRNLFSEPTH